MKPYYYVLDGNSFSNKLETIEEAEELALEIADSNPGKTVEILQCVGITSSPKASTFWMDGIIPPNHLCCFYRGLDDVCIVCGKDLNL